MKDRIAGGANTASKQPECFPANYPKFIEKGEGAYVWDDNGNRFLDFCCSLGPIILGHRFGPVDDVVVETIRETGTQYSLSHKRERILADFLASVLPSAEMSRFATNGKDACEAAVRLARHITDRELILSFSYHGAADVLMAVSKNDKGVPLTLKLSIAEFDYNDFHRVKELFEKYEVAGVILEPHTVRMPENGFLEFLRDITEHDGALLIFDEVVSFPRYPKFSAQSFFNVFPDLTCISKGMANGYPISALVGKEKYMKELRSDGCFVSHTFGGNLIGVSASIATLKEVVAKNVPQHLWTLGETFRAGIRSNDRIKTSGLPCRQFFECSGDDRTKIWQEMIKQGYFFHVPIFFNYSMKIEEMKEAADKLNEVIERLDEVKLEGRRPNEVLKRV